MVVTAGQTFENRTVQMDNVHFSRCTLINCVLEYSGKPVILEETEFKGCQFRFTCDAAMTVNFLKCFDLLRHDANYVSVDIPTLPS